MAISHEVQNSADHKESLAIETSSSHKIAIWNLCSVLLSIFLFSPEVRTVTVPVHKNQFLVRLNWGTSSSSLELNWYTGSLKKELVLVD